MVTSEQVRAYQKKHGVSLMDAKKRLTRGDFCLELRSGVTRGDLVETLVKVLGFEFGEGYE